jgi:hypothetical protein
LRSSAIPPRLQQIIDKALAKEPKDRFQNMDDFRNELRQVLHEARRRRDGLSERDAGAAASSAGANPVSRAVRWLKSITRTDRRLTRPTATPRSRHSRNTVHDVADQEKKSLAILCFRNSEQRSGFEFL